MKTMKKVISVLFALTLALSLCVPAFAETGEYEYVLDYADVLSEKEATALNDSSTDIYNTYGVDISSVIKFGTSYSVDEFAQWIYDSASENGYSSPMVLLIIDLDNAESREYSVYRFNGAEKYLNDDAISTVSAALGKSLTTGDYSDAFSSAVSAALSCLSNYADGGVAAEHVMLTDEADLFTDEQEATLVEKMTEVSVKYDGFNIAFHTTNSIGDKTIVAYADDYYDSVFSVNSDGLLFMLNMNNGDEGNRDYYTSTSGYGITAFTDYAVYDSDSRINSDILPYLQDGDYYGAFTEYLSLIDVFLAQAKTGTPYDSENIYETEQEKRENIIFGEVIALLVALFIAFIVTRILKSKMKTNVKQADAGDYMKPGSLNVTNAADIFSHSNITKTPIPKETSSSGSSTHSSSSGGTHGGGGGKF